MPDAWELQASCPARRSRRPGRGTSSITIPSDDRGRPARGPLPVRPSGAPSWTSPRPSGQALDTAGESVGPAGPCRSPAGEDAGRAGALLAPAPTASYGAPHDVDLASGGADPAGPRDERAPRGVRRSEGGIGRGRGSRRRGGRGAGERLPSVGTDGWHAVLGGHLRRRPLRPRVEYGTDPSLSCDTLATCAAGTWKVNPQTGIPCTTTNSAACPASFGDVTNGGSCADVASKGDAATLGGSISCYFPEARCVCTNACELGCRAASPDGGPLPYFWSCDIPTPASPSCPVPRPRLGESCSAPGDNCDYNACGGGTAIVCVDGGLWQPGNYSCPG